MALVTSKDLDRPFFVAKTRPGMTEKFIVVVAIFINNFGTPASWFLKNSGSASGPESNPVLVYGTLALVGVLAFGLVGNGEAVLRVALAEPILPAFIFLMALSPLWSDHFGPSINGVVNVLLMVLLAIVLLVRFPVEQIIALAAMAMAVGILMDLFWVVALGDLGRTNGAWDGLGTQKNDLGGHSLLALFVLLLAARLFPRWRHFTYGLAVVAGVLLVGSQSKTALASGALTLVCMVVFTFFRARRTLYGAVVISLLAASVTSVLFVTANIGLVAKWLDRDITLSGRTQLWDLVIEAIVDRPWLGYGYDGYFQGPFSAAHPIFTQADWGPTHAHNAYLEMALHVGVIGVVLYVAFTVRAIARGAKCARFVAGPLGIFPLVYFTLATMISFTESGVFAQRFGLVLYLVAIIHAHIAPQMIASPEDLEDSVDPIETVEVDDLLEVSSLGLVRGKN